ncbi:MAG: YHS domain-containing protein [Armatimonadetes bacterium]|nr:YHS domain-containing protein [Armatimonadota bacterium]
MEEFLPTRLNAKKDGQTYKFCSEPCRKSFDANPKKYQVPKASAK